MENNKREVGVTPDDNNNRRLPNSVNGEPVRGDSAYGQGKWDTIKPTALDAGDTGGVVGMPTQSDNFGMTNITKTASVTGPTGMVETTYDHANLSAKYKYPNVHQDVPSKGSPDTQFNDYS